MIWSATDGAAAVYEEDSGTWQRHDASPFREPRVGSSICSNDTHLYVWGGWIDREVLYIAADSGASLGQR